MLDYQFELPYPPTLNHYHSVVGGRKRLSTEGKEYKERCAKWLERQMLLGEKLEGRLIVHIRLHPRTNQKRDLDNFLKAPLDALSEAEFWLDDSQIDKLTITRGEKMKDDPKLIVSVECK